VADARQAGVKKAACPVLATPNFGCRSLWSLTDATGQGRPAEGASVRASPTGLARSLLRRLRGGGLRV